MSQQYLDEALLEELRGILDTEFPILIETFIQDSTRRLADLREALARRQHDDVRKAAHSLKGASANLGLLLLAEECRLLEDVAREGSLDGGADRVEAIAREQARAVVLLRERL